MFVDNLLNYNFENLKVILQSINVGLIKVDKEGKIIDFNKNVKNILGIKCAGTKEENINKILDKLDISKILYSRKNIEEKELFINDKILEITDIPLKDNNGTIGNIFLIKDKTQYNDLTCKLGKQRDVLNILETILEMTYDGLVVIDKDARIKMISKVYSDFLGIDREKSIGKDVTKVIENTRLHMVVKTGIRETADFQKIKGKYIIASRIPIIKEGIVQGAVGKVVFRNLKDFNLFSKKINRIEKQLKQYNSKIHENNVAIYTFQDIISKSEIMDKTKELAKKAAHTTSNVLLIGESGTGKELFAHAIHKASERSYGNFVKVNCAAIPGELLESELFGYEKGAFTGANKNGKIGKFELADGGTIFLDEIGDMPLSMQVKLLRVIQEKEVERIGADYTKSIDIRIIAATNRNLEEMVEQGEFRQDLYYRLNVVKIKIPALRERRADIEILIYYLIGKISRKLSKNINGISKEAVEYMKDYTWEGNIRQLENVIERAINIVDYGEKIDVEHLCKKITGKTIVKNIKKLDEVIKKAEKEAIVNALNACRGNKSKVAKLLQISRTTLYEKMNKHNILG